LSGDIGIIFLEMEEVVKAKDLSAHPT